MRVFIAGLLILGGGLAALALIWLFYSTSDPELPSATAVITDEQTEKNGLNKAAVSTDTAKRKSVPTIPQAEQKESLEPVSNGSPSLQIDVVRIGPDGSAVFAGKGSPDAGVVIFEKGRVLAQTSVSADGEWVAVAEQTLTLGKHLIIVEMTTADGRIYRADQAIVAELGLSGQDTPLVALVPMTEQADVELIQTPNALASASETQIGQRITDRKGLSPDLKAVLVEPVGLSVVTLSWIDQDSLFIKGRSSGGEAVRGTLNDRVFSAIHDADNGDWTAHINLREVTEKSGRLVSHLLNADDEIIFSRQLNFGLDQLDVGRDGSEMIVIEKGDMLWRIAYRTYGNGIRYLDIVKRNQERIVDPDLIYPAQIFALPE